MQHNQAAEREHFSGPIKRIPLHNTNMTESKTAAIKRIRTQLAERWPALFDAEKPVPLAIGIREALLEAMPDITAGLLRHILVGWCSHPRYLAALTVGADRHGLEGVQGTVTEEQAANALELLKAAQTRFREKAEAKLQAKKVMQAAANKKKAEQAKQVEPPLTPPKPVAAKPALSKPPVTPKPATAKSAGPVITVKKRKLPSAAD